SAPAVSLGEITPSPVGASGATASPRATDSSGVQPSRHPSVGCRGRDQCSPQRGRMPPRNPCPVIAGGTVLLHALSSPSHGTTGRRLPAAADIAHTCAWSRQATLPSSCGRVAHAIVAPSVHGTQRTPPFSTTLRRTCMTRHPNGRMHGSTQIRLLRVPRICRVRGRRVRTPRRGPISGHRKQTFSPPNNTVSIPHIQCGINDGAAVHRALC
ncbi:hypothetical protein TcCL_Unassigned01813, partial [Trypanosoma cruzi]